VPIWVVAVLLLIVGSIALSEYAHRRVQRGDSRFAHLIFLPRLVLWGLLVATGIQLSFAIPMVGIPYTLGALLLVGAWLRAGLRVAKSTRPGRTEEEMMVEVGDAAVEPLALYGILVLVFAFLAVVGLIVFGVADRL
jgi:hypothetical protein